MKYHYFYQNKQNEDIDGWIEAKDRTDAYAQLRKRKIRPYKILGRNPVAWRRWTAIAVLAVLCAGLTAYLLIGRGRGQAVPATAERHQIYGDPFTLQRLSANGWRDTFADAGDAWLARHAIPGETCDCKGLASRTNVLSTVLLEIGEKDSPELVKMKQIVNCMKIELRDYLRGRGNQLDYMLLCDERIQKEMQFAKRARVQFSTLSSRYRGMPKAKYNAEWERINDSLRALGLPTVVMPEE